LRARAGDNAAPQRSQASIAVSADGQNWLLVNASPDLRQQIAETPALHPRTGILRNSPIGAVLLTGAEVDTIMGLLHLRERQAFALFGTAQTLAVLDENPIFHALNPEFVIRRAIATDLAFDVLGISVTAYTLPGKVPLFAEAGEDPGVTEDGETIGIAVAAGGKTLHYIPGCAMMTPALRERLAGAACVMFDGTLFTDDEMIRMGAGPKTGRRMGHMPMTGAGSTLEAFAKIPVGRRIFIHINNTNPALLADSPERAQLSAAGWEVAQDGMEIHL